MPTKTEKVFKIFFGIWWCVGVAFFIMSAIFMRGGGALEGKIEHGHYFTAKGRYFEVSKTVYFCSAAVESIWLALMAALVVSYVLVAIQKRNPLWLKAEWASQKKSRF